MPCSHHTAARTTSQPLTESTKAAAQKHGSEACRSFEGRSCIPGVLSTSCARRRIHTRQCPEPGIGMSQAALSCVRLLACPRPSAKRAMKSAEEAYGKRCRVQFPGACAALSFCAVALQDEVPPARFIRAGTVTPADLRLSFVEPDVRSLLCDRLRL